MKTASRHLIVFAICLASSSAGAVNLNHFGPGRAGPGLFSLDAPDVLPVGGWAVRSSYSLSHEPLACVSADDERFVTLKNVHMTALAFAWSPVDALEVSGGLPLLLADVRQGEGNLACGHREGIVGNRLGVNDPELRVRFRAVEVGPLAVSLRAGARVPFAALVSREAGVFFGDPVGSALFGGTVGFRFRRVQAILDVGMNFRPVEGVLPMGTAGRLFMKDELTVGAGVGTDLLWGFHGAVEVNGRFSEVTAPYDSHELQVPLELIGGLKYRLGGVEVTLAAGGGLTSGYGTPQSRILASVAYQGDGLLPFEWLRQFGGSFSDLEDAVGKARATRVKPDEGVTRRQRSADEKPKCPDPLSPEASLVVVPGCPEPVRPPAPFGREDDDDSEADDLFGFGDAEQDGEDKDDVTRREVIVVMHLTFAHDVATLAAGEQERLLREISAKPPGALLLSVEVSAHADASGSDDYNEQLSLRRAQHVTEALVQAGLSRALVSYEARGARDPLLGDRLHDANRRVRVALHYLWPAEAP